MEKNGQRCGQLVLLPCPFQGHINPMLQLGTTLHSKGFSITIVHTQFNSPNPSSHPDFKFHPISDGLSAQDISSGDIGSLIQKLNVNCKSHLQKYLSQIMMGRQGSHDDIVCIIHDEVMYFTEAVANFLELPTIILRTTSAATLLARTTLAQLKVEGLASFQDFVSQDLVPNLHPLRFKDLPFPLNRNLENFSQLINDIYKMRTSSSAIIWNTTDCLERSSLACIQQQCQVPNLPIGPMHKLGPASPTSSLLKEDTNCMAWLEKQTKNSVIYVSLGSIASMNEKELAEMAWGLANSQKPFLWVVRPDSSTNGIRNKVLSQFYKETVGERGCIVNWAPQKEVLAHSAIGGFLSHCGWNSTLESICEGIPMICKPCFGDQRVNARYVSHVWKVGLELESELVRCDIEKAITILMADKEGEAMRERAKNLKEKIELCIKEGGSCNNSLNKLVEIIMSF
ncbi:hypothetical protein ACB098_08G056800 [Castanea mollissima]